MRQLRGSIPRQRERRSARTGGSDAAYLPAQFIEQRLGFFQVGGVEALGEPVVNLCDHRAPHGVCLGCEQPGQALSTPRSDGTTKDTGLGSRSPKTTVDDSQCPEAHANQSPICEEPSYGAARDRDQQRMHPNCAVHLEAPGPQSDHQSSDGKERKDNG